MGTNLALASVNGLVDPRSKRAFADWWKSTAADKFTRFSISELDYLAAAVRSDLDVAPWLHRRRPLDPAGTELLRSRRAWTP